MTAVKWLFLLFNTGLHLGPLIFCSALACGFAALIGFIVARKPLPPGAEKPARTQADSWLSFFGVSAAGLVAAYLFCSGLVVLEREALHALPGIEWVFVALTPPLGGAVAGWLHVALRRRPKRWVLARALALALPLWGVIGVFSRSGEPPAGDSLRLPSDIGARPV